MTRAEREWDEYGKRALAPLQSVPPPDPKLVAEEKAKFLMQGENLRKALIPNLAAIESRRTNRQPGTIRGIFSTSIHKILVVAILVLVLVTASSFTVYAAQGSLPGETLYPIKSASEDVWLSLTFSTEAKLNLTLEYTNRRMNEIRSLVSKGKPLPDQTSDRYQQELDSALQLAAQLNNQQMQSALGEIKANAEGQGMTVEQLIAKLPVQASPAIIHLQQRLQEQVQLSTFGEEDPQQFRLQIQQREHLRQGPKHSSTEEQSEMMPAQVTASPEPIQQENGNGGEMNQATEVPGKGNQGNKQGQPPSGNGNHGPNQAGTSQP
jgi:hypothetical protein